MAYTFDPIFAQDPNNPNTVAKDAAITLFNPADPTKAPITITDPTGSPLPNPITVDSFGMGPAFQHATLERVGWFGAGFTNYLTSYEGMKNTATAAKDAAAASASAAGTAAAAVVTTAAVNGSGRLILTKANAETVDAGSVVGPAGVKGDKGNDGANVLPTDDAIEAAITGAGTKTKAALSATYAPASGSKNYAARNNVSGAFGGVTGALADGVSASLMVMGDSTGNDTGEWVDLVARDLGSLNPTCRVQMKTWDGATERLGPWNVIQAGSLGERHAIVPATLPRSLTTRSADITAPTGDLDIRVKVALDDWTPAGLATLVARYGGAGARSWTMSLNPGGTRLQLDWSTDGTATFASAPPPNMALLADGVTKWVRMTLDVDNGAGGYTCTSYISDDGITWTQLGQNITAGVTSVYSGGTQEYEIGGRSTNAQPAPGKYYEVQIRDGIDGPIVNPQPIDSWTRRIASDALAFNAFGGSPTLYVINGSHPGADLTYLTDATRIKRLLPPMPGALVFLSCSHNDREYVGTEYAARSDTALTALRARIGNTAAFCVITQNPQLPPIDLALAQNNSRRRRERLTWAARNALYSIDTYKAFLDDTRGPAALLKVDGIHPTVDQVNFNAQTGSRLWADTVLAAFKAGI